MNAIETMSYEFRGVLEKFSAAPAFLMLKRGTFTVSHYKAVLGEIYHYAKEDPQIQALATVYFRGEDRNMVKIFFKHALSEVGHDIMALEDLKALGEDVSQTPLKNPLPSTVALTAFPFYQISYRNPIGYLGYLYFLEFMPTHIGSGMSNALTAIGIPDRAMRFLREHMTVDMSHNKLMEEYLRRLIRNQEDLSAAIYAMRVTGSLYASMLQGAIETAHSPYDYGLSFEEAVRTVAR